MDGVSRWAGLAPDAGFGSAGRVVAVAVGLYLLTCAVFYPSVITVTDEATYIRDARIVLTGQGGIPVTNPYTGGIVILEPNSRYPLGTAMLMAPFVALADWRGAFALPMLCVLLGVAFTARWLAEAGRSPLYALAILGYPATLVMGRVAMSDSPSLFVAALGLWLFWRGRTSAWPWFLASGGVAGASVLFRESNVLLFAPLFVGAVLRRDRHVWALVVGGLLGLSLRLVAGAVFFHDPFFMKQPDPFRLAAVLTSAPIYLASLLVLVPAGLAAGLTTRGERAPEIIATVAGFTLFYCLYGYSATESGLAKRLILGPRYFLPLLPVLAFAMSEALPRFASRLGAAGQRWFLRSVAVWIAGVLTACVVVPLALDRFNAGQAAIRDQIEQRVPGEGVLVTNSFATGKFLDVLDRPLPPLKHTSIGHREMRALLDRHGKVHVVLLDRSDSAYWQRQSQENEAYVRTLHPVPRLVYDEQITPTDRLRIWTVSD